MLKKLILSIPFLLLVLTAFAQDLPPKSTTLVTDYTNTLSAQDKQQLESKLVQFADTATTQIAVVLIKSVGDYDINDYGQKLGRAWGIGQKGLNNGILLLVAVGDRKLTIQTGRGAEGAVPDIVTHEIIQNDITPQFKQGNYYAGLDAGTNKLIQYMKGEYKTTKKATRAQDDGGPGGFIVLIIIVVVILIVVFRRRGGGGGGQIIGGRGGASPFWWFLGGAMLGRGSGGWGGFSGGSGGFGDSGGGSDSGGSFGGFGGGDFGGGGSSGSW